MEQPLITNYFYPKEPFDSLRAGSAAWYEDQLYDGTVASSPEPTMYQPVGEEPSDLSPYIIAARPVEPEPEKKKKAGGTAGTRKCSCCKETGHTKTTKTATKTGGSVDTVHRGCGCQEYYGVKQYCSVHNMRTGFGGKTAYKPTYKSAYYKPASKSDDVSKGPCHFGSSCTRQDYSVQSDRLY